ncbi:MAG: zinc ribbon domain-containing protein [Acidobacteria bacterium]|nr:zinc ribbon domain-containing protein [Acidobacteriota bacterium]
MPLFDFQCLACGAVREVLLHTGQSDPTACAACGAEVRRLLSTPADLKRMDGFFHKDNASDSQLASKGLAKYVNRGDGTYEKASGSGPSIMSRDTLLG